MSEFIETNRRYLFYPMLTFIIGVLMGVGICSLHNKQTKEYPIEVRCYWSTNGLQSWPSMDADSVKGDTIWKDGLSIVNKNITNIQFK